MPRLNFDAETYHEIINWSNVNSEPPLCIDLSTESIEDMRFLKHEIPDYPCHSQGVERAVKLVSSVCLKNLGN